MAAPGPAPDFSPADYQERLAHELEIINSMEYPGYFLIVADIIKWAKSRGIPVGPGRGSGAASVVAWALTITDLDPLRFNLVFERFLNPHRVSMPDFDIDFCPERRDEVIGYIRDRYGRDRVAQIITFGKLQARAVLRDVGRVLQMPYGQVDRLCKLVPNNPADPVTLAQAIAGEPALAEARERDETVARLLRIGENLEGLYRHASTHAAGVVIADRPLVELVPLTRDPRSDMLVTQFSMKWVEQAGLVKFDILGLKTLTVLSEAASMVREAGTKIDLADLPLDDPATYRLLASGETQGVFQFESSGMRDLLVKAEASNFEDLIALVALFRPGPMENIPRYLACKHRRESPERLHELIEPVVADTYGVIIYQEQVLQIAQHLAGYSLAEADLLRRAMGKKIQSEMDAQRARFVEGAAAKGVDGATATRIFELVDKFAGYGFNKAHSAAYALVAYQTAYMKANHPVAFMAASMTHDMANTDKLALFRHEAVRMGIAIRPPSINASGAAFLVEGGSIRYGLAALRNVGRQAIEHVVAARGTRAFFSLGDFASRIDPRLLGRRALEGLARAGAFDDLAPNRAAVLASAERILQAAQRSSEDRLAGQDDLFVAEPGRDAADVPLAEAEPWDHMRLLAEELEAVGSYLSGHPLDDRWEGLAASGVSAWRDFEARVAAGQARSGRLAGTVTSRRDRRGRGGARYAFVGFSDPTGQFESVVFSDTLAESEDLLQPGTPVVLGVEAEPEGERVRLRVQSVEPVRDEPPPGPSLIRVFLRDEAPLAALGARLSENGEDRVSIVLIDAPNRREVEMRLAARYAVSNSLAGSIRAIPGVVAIEREPLARSRPHGAAAGGLSMTG
jgi:DNA polymerase-3 subunit alpha